MAGYLITFFQKRVRPIKLLTREEVKEIEDHPQNYEKEEVYLIWGYCPTCGWDDAPLKSETGQCLLCLGWIKPADAQAITINPCNFYMVIPREEILFQLESLSLDQS